jgi:hypothetical protein
VKDVEGIRDTIFSFLSFLRFPYLFRYIRILIIMLLHFIAMGLKKLGNQEMISLFIVLREREGEERERREEKRREGAKEERERAGAAEGEKERRYVA